MPSGQYSLVNGVVRLSNWTLNDTKTSQTYVASNTLGGTARGGGIRDWNGTMSGQGGTPPVMPNQEFDFEGYTYPDNGTLGGDGTTYVGEAIVQQVTVVWDWVNNALLAWTANFVGKPGLTIVKQAPTLDASAVANEFACGSFAAYQKFGEATDIEIPKLTTGTLTITANLSQSANSSTRSGGDCFIDRDPGSIDWTFSAGQEDYERGVDGYPDLGDDVTLKLFTKPDLSEWWQLRWGRQEDYTGLSAEAGSNTPIARTINLAMNAATTDGAGHIYQPASAGAGTPWWGVA